MKKILLLCMILGMVSINYSQTITVKDQESGAPLHLATLLSPKPKASVITNVNGQADISALKGSQHIEFQMLGYKKKIVTYDDLASQNFILEVETSKLNLDEVVVSATRWRQNSSNIPSKIISVAPKEVALQNPQTTADLLGISGKVFIQKSQQGGGSPMIRGFATNRLLYTIDGVRMNTAIFRGGNIQNVISLDPFAMEHTEVFFGPGSVIYGSDAIGGVMSFQTLAPELSLNDKTLLSGKAIMRYSSANREKTGHFHVSVGGKKWAMLTSVSYFNYDDLKQGSHGPDDYIKPYHVVRQDSLDVIIHQADPLLQIPTAYSQINLMQKVRFKPSDKWDFQYGFHYSETSSYGRYDRNNRVRNDLPRYGEWNYGPQKWMMNNLSIEHHARHSLYDLLSIRLAQQSFEESRFDRNFNAVDRHIRTENVQAYSANIDFSKEWGKKNSLFYGFEYVLNTVESTGTDKDISTGISIMGPSRYPQSNWQSIAVYVNDQYHFSDQFLVQAGLRYNQFILNADFDTTFYPFPFTETKLNNGALTGSLGAVYRPADDWIINANLATAFRSPNVDDIGKVFDSEPGAVVIPNPNLEAEYAYNADIGAAKIFGDWLKIDFTAYYTILQNAMVRRDYQLNGQDSIIYDGSMSKVQAIQNAAVAHVYGIQAGFEMKLPSGFGLNSDINYQKGEEEMDDGSLSPSRHAAPVFGVTRLTYSTKKLQLELNTYYQGERKHNDLPYDEQSKDEIYAKDQNGLTYAPAWYTLNFKSMYQFSEMLSLSAGIENITDQRYRSYSSGISGPGRNFIFSIKLNF
jgi:hemoglobin/transferrin/lactoferrin receptor protein